jgi:hypothetical protein
MRLYLAGALVCLGACATATKSGNAPDAGKRDSSGGGDSELIDSPPSGPDAAQMITVSETANTTIVSGGTTACQDTNSSSPTFGNTGDNIWYRAFQLSDYAMITGGMHISAVTMGIESSSTPPPLTIKINNYTGTLDGTSITSGSTLATAMYTPGDVTNTTAMVPISADIPAGGKFVVVISAPDDVNNGFFFLGSTAGAQTHKGYWSSTDCMQSTPMVTSGSDHIIIDVVGTH